MLVRKFSNFVIFLCLFSAIWSREPVKMILSAMFLYFTFKYFVGENKIIGMEIVEKTLPIRSALFLKGKI